MSIKAKLVLSIIFIIAASSLQFAQPAKRNVRIIKTAGDIKIKKLDSLNSRYPELNLSITPDGKYLYFMSSRPNTYSTKNYNGREDTYDGDIYYSINNNGKWSRPVALDRTINSPQGEDEPNVSPDGQIVYFQSWKFGWEGNGGPYYKAQLKGDHWLSPEGLNSGITQFFVDMRRDSSGLATDGSTFSPDGKKFIFSFGDNYYSAMDLFISVKDEYGNWSTPNRLSINTPYNERNPFMAADGKTLYFSSNGYNGFGKMDIYKTTINDDGSCGDVVNIGEPFNTIYDDQCFVLTANGDELFFVRNDDIYYSDLKNIISEIKPNPAIIIGGKVTDIKTKKFLESELKLIDIETGEEAGNSLSNSINGNYSLIGKLNKKYQIHVVCSGYVSINKELIIPQEMTSQRVAMDFNMTKEETEPIVEPVKNKESSEQEEVAACVSKLEGKSFSIGICPLYPYAIGIKTEAHKGNFGGILIATYLPNVGRYDEIKPPDELKNDNYSTSLMISIIYNIPLTCRLYPFIGIYTGYQFRNWKKPIMENGVNVVKEGSYSGSHYGLSLGLKIFMNDYFYLEGGGGIGKNSVHAIPSGDVLHYEWQFIPWFSICYILE
jgi:hypothetical protein